MTELADLSKRVMKSRHGLVRLARSEIYLGILLTLLQPHLPFVPAAWDFCSTLLDNRFGCIVNVGMKVYTDLPFFCFFFSYRRNPCYDYL